LQLWNSENALIYNGSTDSYYLYKGSDGSNYECKNLDGYFTWGNSELINEIIIDTTSTPAIGFGPYPTDILIYNLPNGTNQTIPNGSFPSSDGNYFAFESNENAAGIDLNKDGDTSDYLIRLISLDDVEVLKSPYEPEWKVGGNEILILLVVLVIVSIIRMWQKKTSP